ncbi:unnamed protein product [Trifolium pratense]|uniref:Uncharacterized protein n=1 Tax=Trifolium pratense TaxID=57577 RepID=A0ACB0KC31_TRIPR|nr:unnamed protein product [Trifolium pratense]
MLLQSVSYRGIGLYYLFILKGISWHTSSLHDVPPPKICQSTEGVVTIMRIHTMVLMVLCLSSMTSSLRCVSK